MTAKQAIRKECLYCNNTPRFNGCASDICKLNDVEISSSVKKIKAHCLTCVSTQSYEGVKNCDGKVMNFDDGRTCPLHPYRYGKNPSRKKRQISAEELAAMKLRLVRKPQPEAQKGV